MNGGLNFLVEDRDGFSNNDLLGVTMAPAAALYKAKGERMEFKFNTKGFLALRCRRATENDKSFMTQYQKSRVAVVAQDRPNTLSNDILSMVSKTTKKVEGAKLVCSGLSSILQPRPSTNSLTIYSCSTKCGQALIHRMLKRVNG